jgi:hypothetical protein
LWLGAVKDGKWITTYDSTEILSGSAWKLAQEFEVLGLLPLGVFDEVAVYVICDWETLWTGISLGDPKFERWAWF